MEIQCSECASYLANDSQIARNHLKIKWVVGINLIMMIGEVFVGYTSGSMSLVAEGWHMGSHVGALSITLIAYRLAHSAPIEKRLSFGGGKLIPLGGYTSAVILGMVALLILFESAERLFAPVSIQFNEALFVAVIGLSVNVLSALILNVDPHHGHSHDHEDDDHDHKHVHDHNIRSAFLHVSADAVTSLLAIMALSLGKFYHWNFLDPVIGIVGAVVIFTWALQLCHATGWELLDRHSKTVDWTLLRSLIEEDGTQILDFHIWRIAPKAVACELIVTAKNLRGTEYYREILRDNFSAQHVVIEERSI